MRILKRSVATALALGAAIVLLSPGPAMAQTDVTTGRIAGQVLDDSGQALPGVSVEAKSKGTGLTLSQVTDTRGLYRILNVPVGTYDVKAQLSGFQPQTRGSVTVTLGGAVTADFKLNLASVSEAVTVTAEVPTIETTQTASQATVDNNAIKALPINGRNFTDFVYLTPNAVKSDSRGYVSIAGARGINSSITLDGVDFNNAFFGGATAQAEGRSARQVSQESVQEFQVIQNGASVEFGRSGGGFINVVTKSGTNDFHGSALYYTRPQSLVANFANGTEPRDQKTNQYGASIGGRFIPDRLFFFASGEVQRQETTQTVDDRLTAAGLGPEIVAKYPRLVSGSSYQYTQDDEILFGRFDFQVSDKHRVTLRDNFINYEGLNATRVGTGFATSYNGLEKDKSNAVVLQWNGIFSANVLNDLSLQYIKEDQPRADNSPDLTEVQYVGSTRLGGVSFLPIEAEQDRKTISDSLTFLAGAHAAKLGFEYNDTNMNQIFKGNWRGVFVFSGSTDAERKANLLAGNWSQYRQFLGLGGLNADQAGQFDKAQKELAFFIQDQWFATPSITVTLGLRYERQNNPDDAVLDLAKVTVPNSGLVQPDAQIPDANNQWSPRLSIAWSPEKSGKSVVRLSAGRYWSRTPSILFSQLYTSNGIVGTQYILNPADLTGPLCATPGSCPGRGATFNPVGVQQIKGSPSNIPTPGVFSIDPDYQNPRTDKVSLAVEREVFGVAVGLEGQYSQTENLERVDDANLSVSTNRAVDCPNAHPSVTCFSPTRPNKSYGRITVYRSDARSRFKSLSLSLRKSFSNGFRFFGSATYNKDEDNDSNERNFSGFAAEDVRNIEGSFGPSDRNVEWRFIGNLSYEKQFGIITVFASGILNFQSGRPFTPTVGSDLNRDGESFTDRASSNGVHFERNSFTNEDFFKADVRLGVGVNLGPGKLSVFGEAFNVTNHPNRGTSNTTWGSGSTPNANFGTLNTFGDPRTFQIAARYDF